MVNEFPYYVCMRNEFAILVCKCRITQKHLFRNIVKKCLLVSEVIPSETCA